MSNALNWKQLASIKVGGAICLPVIISGHALCQHYGFASALFAIIMGNALLLLMALGMARMSVEAKLTTTDNAQNYFGRFGTRCFAAALMTVKTCWMAIQLSLMTLSLKVLLPWEIPQGIINVFLGTLVILVSMQGIHALTKLTSLSLPLLIATLVYALYNARNSSQEFLLTPLRWEGISLVMATAVAAVIDMPTYFRHAKSYADSTIAAIIFIGIAVPLIEAVGVYLCHRHPGATVMETLQQADAPLWNGWVVLFLLLAGWSTNNSNLFSAVAGLGTLLPKVSQKQRTLLIGTAGVVLSLTGILEAFVFVLQLLGTLVVSMGSVIVSRYLLNKIMVTESSPNLNLAVWGVGALMGIASMGKFITLTTIPLIDSCITAALITTVNHLMNYLWAKKDSTKRENVVENL